MRSTGAIPLIAFALAGCVGPPADHRDDDGAEMAEALAGRSAGEGRQCITLTSTGGPRIIGNDLLYRDGRRLWVSEAVGGCPSLRGDPVLIVEVQGAQLCANDRFRTLPRGGSAIPGPYCRFGRFVPWVKSR